MKTCLMMILSHFILLTLLIVSDKTNGKAVAKIQSTSNTTDSNCDQEINNIITAFNNVKRDLEELKRNTDKRNDSRSESIQFPFINSIPGIKLSNLIKDADYSYCTFTDRSNLCLIHIHLTVMN